MFSTRTPADFRPNPLSEARARARVRFDLTISNPTQCGIAYPQELLRTIGGDEGLVYRPDPRGLEGARTAVAREYERHGITADPKRIVLTASTSEAYAFLFKLLCEPGDAVLVPAPSYPLFEHLARVEGVRPVTYRLDAEHGWRIDPEELGTADAPVRAVIAVNPNNPTGSFVHPDDAERLERACARRGWALIADEVFLDYPLAGGPGSDHSFAATGSALTFALGGLSKSAGLPQLKLAWTVVSGPGDLVRPALERLEFIADTFLSVATPVQLALPRLLTDGLQVREAIRERCRTNLAALATRVASLPSLELLAPGGGWSAVVRFPAVVGEEELALELLRKDGVAVHPGYFFDFARDGYLVVSLLPEAEMFAAGADLLVARIAAYLR
jgi:alanine-synthesizing transaminase